MIKFEIIKPNISWGRDVVVVHWLAMVTRISTYPGYDPANSTFALLLSLQTNTNNKYLGITREIDYDHIWSADLLSWKTFSTNCTTATVVLKLFLSEILLK